MRSPAFNPPLFLILTAALVRLSSAASQDCPTRCGSISLSYPFGIGAGCFRPGFGLICDTGVLYMSKPKKLQVVEISQGQVRVNSSMHIARNCPLQTTILDNVVSIILDGDGPYTFSSNNNKLIVIGCNGRATISSGRGTRGGQCISSCDGYNTTVDASCNGNACCGLSIPKFNKKLVFFLSTGGLLLKRPNTCVYAFLTEEGRFTLGNPHVTESNSVVNTSMRIEWAIGEQKCNQAATSADYACGGNTTCVDADRGSGYLCKCLDGYEGNPYLNGSLGCQDIDECGDSKLNLCVRRSRCENRVPGYVCKCQLGSFGDGMSDQKGCSKRVQIIVTSVGSCIAAAAIVMCFSWCYCARKRRKIRAMYFKQNGGLLFKQCFNGVHSNCIHLLPAAELEAATNNFNKRRILGSGGQGAVYRGVLSDGSIIAVKKSKQVAQSHVDQFINELVVLSQVSHKNIVKILGCCLETQVPLLVYEFIPNGTLQQKLQDCAKMSWIDRLRIAIGIAEALSYLHSHEFKPIVHRDVKSSNILLDENFTPKVTDFGISRLIVAPDEFIVTTAVRGTIGYLDPEYHRTGKLTEKSDVYSFGVVLLELLTCLQPAQHEEACDYSGLVMRFFSYVQGDRVLQMFDEDIRQEAQTYGMQAVTEIVMCCLSMKGEERPSMQMVAQGLLRITIQMKTTV